MNEHKGRFLKARPSGNALAAGGIVLLAFAAYWPALSGSLLWNDPDYVTKPGLRSLHGLWRIWFEVGATEQYYPILHSTFWMEHRLWGDWAAGYHAANVALHALAACLFATILRRLAVPGAWLAACLLTVHPVCVESVAWISEQKNTLSLVFYLLSALAYLRFDQTRGLGAYAAGFVWFALATLSKSVTATLPAALLVVFWWRRGSLSWRRDALPLLPWLGLGAGVGLFTAWVERTYIGASGAAFSLGFVQRCLLAGRAAWFYLGKLAWPVNLTFIYPRWTVDAGNLGQYLYPLGALALVAALWLIRGRSRGPLAVALLFGGSLFPTLGFFNVYAFVFSFVADHWQYLASLAVFAGAAAAWAQWRERAGHAAHSPAVAASALVAVLAVLTWRQTRMYRDVETLYRTTLERNPESWLAQNNLGGVLVASGRQAEALEHYREAARIAPHYPEIYSNWGAALVQLGRMPEAIAQIERALRIEPNYVSAQVNLANALLASGRPADAAAHYEAALRIRPGNSDWELGLGVSLARIGRMREAIAHDEAALRLMPDSKEAHGSLGNALEAVGDLPDAIAQFREVLRIAPRDPEGHYALAGALGNAGQIPAAVAEYQEAVRLRPDYAEARANLGLALATGGRFDEALAQLTEAVRLKPAYPEAHAYLGFALAGSGRPREAVGEYRQALRLSPNNPDVHYQLGMVLRALGETAEAAAELAAAARP